MTVFDYNDPNLVLDFLADPLDTQTLDLNSTTDFGVAIVEYDQVFHQKAVHEGSNSVFPSSLVPWGEPFCQLPFVPFFFVPAMSLRHNLVDNVGFERLAQEG